VIDRVYSISPSPDPKIEMQNIRALMDRAEKAQGLTVEDRAKLQSAYGVAVAHNNDYAGGAAEGGKAVAMLAAAGKGDSILAAEILQNQGVNQSLSGHPEQGLATLQRALAIQEKVYGPNSQEVGEILGALGYTADRFGHLQEAMDYYRRSLALTKSTESFKVARTANLSVLHSVLTRAGYWDEALEVSEQMARDTKANLTPRHRGIVISMMNLGTDLVHAGRYDEGEAMLRKGLAQALENEGPEGFDTVTVSANLGRLLVQQGHEAEGETMLVQSAETFQKIRSSQPESAVNVWITLAHLSLTRGDAAQAEQRAMKALGLLNGLTTRAQFERLKLNNLVAQIRLVHGDSKGALEALDASLAYARKELGPAAEERCETEMLHALALSRLDRKAEALEEGSKTASAMEALMLDAAVSQRHRMDVSAAYQVNFIRYADIALASDRPDLAFRAAQLSAFTEVAATSQALAARAAASTPQAEAMARALQDAQETREHLISERSFAVGKSQGEVDRLDQRIKAVDEQVSAADTALVAAFPAYHALSRPTPVDLDAARARLSDHQALILPLVSEDRLIVLALTRQGLKTSQSPMDRPTVERQAHALRASIDRALQDEDATGFDRAAALALGSHILPKDLRRSLGKVSELQIIGSGPLMAAPASLLILEPAKAGAKAPLRSEAFLIKSYAVSVRPSIGAASARSGAAHRGFIGVGAPVLAPAAGPTDEAYRGLSPKVSAVMRSGVRDINALRQLPSLPGAEEELKSMARALALPSTTLIIGRDATWPRIRNTAFEPYNVIAFATHGLINGDLQDLKEPALVLTPPETATPDDDGLLTASRIAGLKLNADWIILSACNTGSGRGAGSAGLTGLARAFMQAGGRNLLISMWPVRDDVARRLTVDTVSRHAAGLSQSQALRRSLLSLMADRSVAGSDNPAIWAPFALVAQD
jgi:CHAT domain-containing protein